MKNKLIGAFASVLATTALIATPVNNPASSAQFGTGLFTGDQQGYTLRTSYVANATQNRYLKHAAQNAEQWSSGYLLDNKVAQSSSYDQGVKVTFGMFDRIDLSAGYGRSSSSLKFRNFMQPLVDNPTDGEGAPPASAADPAPAASQFLSTSVGIEADDSNYWNVALEGILWSFDDTDINVGASYLNRNGNLDSISFSATELGSFIHDVKQKTREWAVSLGLSHFVSVSDDMGIAPFAAVIYSDAKTHFNVPALQQLNVPQGPTTTTQDAMALLNNIQNIKLKSRRHVGLALGVGLYGSEMIALNIETRLFDENAVSVSLDINI